MQQLTKTFLAANTLTQPGYFFWPANRKHDSAFCQSDMTQ